MSILIVAIACAAWFIIGGPAAENTLTLILSVLAITLTQMVLNQQRLSERALHMKIDELVYAMQGARDEIAGIEGRSEEDLEAPRRNGEVVENILEDGRRYYWAAIRQRGTAGAPSIGRHGCLVSPI